MDKEMAGFAAIIGAGFVGIGLLVSGIGFAAYLGSETPEQICAKQETLTPYCKMLAEIKTNTDLKREAWK